MLKVVIVDDDKNVCSGLETLIDWHALNCELVGTAHSGETALELVVKKSPDIMISDIKMPNMNGLELCRKVREIRSDLDIILLSAYEDFSYAQTAIENGVKNYILKPINRQKLNEISSIIAHISKDHENQLVLNDAINDIMLENSIINALKNGDSDFFNNFFTGKFPLSANSNYIIKQWCIKLIGIIIDFMAYTGVDSNICFTSKSKLIREINAIKLKDDMKCYIEKLFNDVLQFHKKGNSRNYILERIIRFIDENLSNPDMNVSSIADHFNLSANYINIVFKQANKVNISSYIVRERIKKARTLMGNDKLSLNEISVQTGFSDSHYFTKVFKKLEGITPSEYRSLKPEVLKKDVL